MTQLGPYMIYEMASRNDVAAVLTAAIAPGLKDLTEYWGNWFAENAKYWAEWQEVNPDKNYAAIAHDAAAMKALGSDPWTIFKMIKPVMNIEDNKATLNRYYKKLSKEVAEREVVTPLMTQYQNKFLMKLKKIIPTTELVKVEARRPFSHSGGGLSGQIYFEFDSGINFIIRTNVVSKWARVSGKWFYQYPFTFHDVVAIDGKKTKKMSQREVENMFLEATQKVGLKLPKFMKNIEYDEVANAIRVKVNSTAYDDAVKFDMMGSNANLLNAKKESRSYVITIQNDKKQIVDTAKALLDVTKALEDHWRSKGALYGRTMWEKTVTRHWEAFSRSASHLSALAEDYDDYSL